ncbi:MAG: hypothetical protein J0I70_15950 [Microbacterium sp.]|uniref:hypothetical protein n=1 Tax=Microbacterium sp. TaxID=51671 RepID=UPI001AC3AD33|nr:hypothetical protein [Microbacterium sp.]MBN9153294.1 hypothetical protein [Microbacterium sp.]MBN9175637.1 hypothetical protein [Microbacterium sp.]
MEQIASWSEFNVAMAGATAALAGLVIVAASVNIADIIKAESLTARLASSIATLVLAIIASAVGLIPGISDPWYGAILLVGTAAALVFQVAATVRILQNHHPENRMRVLKSALGFLPPAAYAAGGILLLVASPAGFFLIATGSILAIVVALVVSWIVLVEVLR